MMNDPIWPELLLKSVVTAAAVSSAILFVVVVEWMS
jgi:hypothetical protein